MPSSVNEKRRPIMVGTLYQLRISFKEDNRRPAPDRKKSDFQQAAAILKLNTW